MYNIDELSSKNISELEDIAKELGISIDKKSSQQDIVYTILDEQAKMLNELFPDVKKVGLLYCSAEANSKFQIDTITPYLTDFGYEVKEYTFSDSNDIAAVATTACDECEVLYIPTDNTAASNTGIIDNIAVPKNVPIVCGEEGICTGCGVAALSISYYDLGRETGEMAYEILVNKADPATMNIKYVDEVKIMTGQK